jgi:tetratricopeptide (TPR) repeat protein
MFFGKLFKKDHRHYLQQGEKHLAAERYADARVEFLEALKCCPPDADKDQRVIREGLQHAGNRLGELNMQEGERSLNAGDLAKAYDNFTLAGELAFDETLKAMAREAVEKLGEQADASAPIRHNHGAHGGSSCGSCNCSGGQEEAAPESVPLDLSEEDRFSLLVEPLGAGLASRYRALGPGFAKTYLMIHDGNDAAALPLLQEMIGGRDDDIVIYEVALIMYRSGQVHECEELLNRAIALNPGNPMTYLALVHLMADRARYPEALATVRRMMELGVLADQAQFMLGELHEAAGDQAAAVDAWTRALALPAVARSAAERLIPVLQGEGRGDEAKYLAKRYLKGCC